MNNRNIEQALNNAINSAPAIPFEELAAIEFIKLPEHDYITKQEEKARPSQLKRFTLAVTCCLLILLSVTGWYRYYRVSDSIIMLDVNPSIEIRTNHSNRILSVTALNQDAGVVLQDSDYHGKKLSEAVASIMDSLVENQYLNTDKNAILLTVINKNGRKADTLLNETASTIEDSLTAQNIKPTIMKQIIKKESDRSKLADQYHISEGKMNLIQEMAARNDQWSIDQLAGMSIQRLIQLARENSIDLSKYLTAGDMPVSSAPDNSGSITKGLSREDSFNPEYGYGEDKEDLQQISEEAQGKSDIEDEKDKEHHENSGESEEDGDTNGNRDYEDREEDDGYHKSTTNIQHNEDRYSSKNHDSDERKESGSNENDQEKDLYSDHSSGTGNEDQQNQGNGSQNEENQDQEVINNENQNEDEPDQNALNEENQSSDDSRIESQDSDNQSEEYQKESDDSIQYQEEADN